MTGSDPVDGPGDDPGNGPGSDPGDELESDGSAAAVQSFYGRWAGLYDPIARWFPRIRAVRRQAALACRLERGNTVVEVGCGTGANLPYLRDQVGPEGTVVGLDLARGMLAHARDRFSDVGNVHLVEADGRSLPVDGPVDAVLGTFVSGMFEEPVGVVNHWCDLASGGHVVLVDAAPSRRPLARPVNGLFRVAVAVSTPPTGRLRYEEDLVGTLDRRVSAAHRRVRERSSAVATDDHLLGLIRLTGGRIHD